MVCMPLVPHPACDTGRRPRRRARPLATSGAAGSPGSQVRPVWSRASGGRRACRTVTATAVVRSTGREWQSRSAHPATESAHRRLRRPRGLPVQTSDPATALRIGSRRAARSRRSIPEVVMTRSTRSSGTRTRPRRPRCAGHRCCCCPSSRWPSAWGRSCDHRRRRRPAGYGHRQRPWRRPSWTRPRRWLTAGVWVPPMPPSPSTCGRTTSARSVPASPGISNRCWSPATCSRSGPH